MNPLNRVPIDKMQHFIAGVVLSSLSICVLGAYASSFVGVVVALFAGAIKETIDASKGYSDVYDFVATVLGGIVVTVPAALMEFIF